MNECKRIVRNLRTGERYFTTLTAKQCHPEEHGKEYIVPAFKPNNDPMSIDEKIELCNAKAAWLTEMRRKMPGFQKRKYKYVILTRVEG